MKKASLIIICFLTLSQNVFSQEEGFPMNEKLKEMIGKPIPELVLPDMNWNEVKLSEVKSKALLIDFWASWCRYCRSFNQEISDLRQLYNKQGFEIVSVSFDTDYYKWKRATKVDGIDWINVNERAGMDSELTTIFNIDHTPTTFLLDSNKVVVGIDLEGDELEEKIKELIK